MKIVLYTVLKYFVKFEKKNLMETAFWHGNDKIYVHTKMQVEVKKQFNSMQDQE